MRIYIDSNMTIYGLFKPPIEIELEDKLNTLNGLLMKLTELCRSVEFINDGQIGNDVRRILINDVEKYNLNTGLNNQDKVMIEIEMAPLGGG